MKLLTIVFCLIFGHNKILDSGIGGKFPIHHITCTQCQKKWFTKKLVSTHKIKFKKYEIKMRAQGQKIVIKAIHEEILLKIPKVNFYAL